MSAVDNILMVFNHACAIIHQAKDMPEFVFHDSRFQYLFGWLPAIAAEFPDCFLEYYNGSGTVRDPKLIRNKFSRG